MSVTELTAKQIAYLNKQLILKAAELNSQVDEFSQNAEPVALDQQSVGRVSRIDAIQQQQMAIANRDQSIILIKRISAALQRVEANTYGFCLQCEEPIAFARLEAQPFTPYCLDCQSALEQQ